MNRRTLLATLMSAAALLAAADAGAQTADNFPNRPIRIIVPQAAGSGIDLLARTLAQKMGELWGQSGVVENRAGANAIIGMEVAARAAPDGYTLVYAPVSSVTTNQFIYKEGRALQGRLPPERRRENTPLRDLIDAGKLSLSGLITHREAAGAAAGAYRTAFGDPSCLKMVLDWRACA